MAPVSPNKSTRGRRIKLSRREMPEDVAQDAGPEDAIEFMFGPEDAKAVASVEAEPQDVAPHVEPLGAKAIEPQGIALETPSPHEQKKHARWRGLVVRPLSEEQAAPASDSEYELLATLPSVVPAGAAAPTPAPCAPETDTARTVAVGGGQDANMSPAEFKSKIEASHGQDC